MFELSVYHHQSLLFYLFHNLKQIVLKRFFVIFLQKNENLKIGNGIKELYFF